MRASLGVSKEEAVSSKRFVIVPMAYFILPTMMPASYHRIRALPQVSPPPKTGRQIRCPSWMLPSLTASSNAMAQDAEEMFPYLWRVT